MKSRRTLIVLIAAALPLAVSPPAYGAFPGANGKIAFDCATEDGRVGICTVNADGTALALTIDGGSDGARDPAWSADGKRLAFAQGDGWIATALADGSGRVRSVVQGSHPAWTPDGRLSYIDTDGDGNLWVANPDGTHRQQLTSDALRGSRHVQDEVAEWIDVIYGGPAWSPDGKQVAIQRSVQQCRRDYDVVSCFQRESEYLTLASDGTGRTKLADTSTAPSPNYFELGPPSWLPDGKQLVLAILDTANKAFAVELHRIRADGTGQHAVGIRARGQAVSPDGRRIAYVGAGGLTTVCVDGRTPTVIPSYGPGNPDWQPAANPPAPSGGEQCAKPPARIARHAVQVCRRGVCRLRLTGALEPPGGGWACDGRIVAAVYAGRRRIVSLRKPVSPDCRFAGRLRWRERPNRVLALRLRYTGGAVFAPTLARPLELSRQRRSARRDAG